MSHHARNYGCKEQLTAGRAILVPELYGSEELNTISNLSQLNDIIGQLLEARIQVHEILKLICEDWEGNIE